MSADMLLEELRRRGVVLQVVGDKIRFPRDSIPPALREEMRRHKAELLTALVLQELAGKQRCACGWYCYDFDLALPCKVALGEQTLEEYAWACYPDEPERVQAIIDLYRHAYNVWQKVKTEAVSKA